MSSPHQRPAARKPTRAVVLAAGKGNRLRPLTDNLPKPLLPLGSSSILEQNLDWLAGAGVHEIVINLHHRGDAIRALVGDGRRFGLAVSFSDEPELLGTAGGTRKAAKLLPTSWPLLVVYGDNLTRLDLDRMSECHAATGGIATIAVHRVPDVSDSGLVRFSEGGEIEDFVEKAKGLLGNPGWVNAGVYLLEAAVLDAVPARGATDFGYDIFPKLISRGLFAHRLTAGEHIYPIDTPERYREAITSLLPG